MRNWQVAVGVVVIIIGALFLISALTGFNVWGLICPVGLILAGVALIIRTRRVSLDTAFSAKFIGDIRRRPGETVKNQEIWLGIADVDLFLTDADIPAGETKFRLIGFVGDIDLRIPEDVGVSVSSLAFVTDAQIFGGKTSNIVTPYEYASPGYVEAARKIRLECVFFVADLKVRTS